MTPGLRGGEGPRTRHLARANSVGIPYTVGAWRKFCVTPTPPDSLPLVPLIPTLPSDPDDALLADLNAAQREAVTADEGPLLVVAGAGTGKTRVLTRRVAWRILHGLDPRSILAITFTNKAAGVLKERLRHLPGGFAVTAGTFHGFCALLLRRFADRVGRTTDFTILDKEDQTRLLRSLCDDLKIDTTAYRPAEFGHAISHRKNGGVGRAPALLTDGRFVEHLEKVVEGYGKKLRAASLFDFDDLLLEAVRVLDEVPEAREETQARWSPPAGRRVPGHQRRPVPAAPAPHG